VWIAEYKYFFLTTLVFSTVSSQEHYIVQVEEKFKILDQRTQKAGKQGHSKVSDVACIYADILDVHCMKVWATSLFHNFLAISLFPCYFVL